MVIPFQIIMVPIVGLATDPSLSTIWGIIPMYWGLGAPLAVFMYHGFVKGVPRELEEAAAIEVGGQFFVFFRVVFPLMKPITAASLILSATPIIVLYLALQKYVIRGIAAGAVKG